MQDQNKETINIVIKIGEHNFPLAILPEEEELYRKAQKVANDFFLETEKNTGEKDRAKTFASCFLSSVYHFLQLKEQKEEMNQNTQKTLQKIHNITDNLLNQT